MQKKFYLTALIAVITIIFGTVYGASQQVLRLSANDPQIQIAEDTANELLKGTPASSLVSGKIDVSKSIAPFIMVYDNKGKLIASPAYTNNLPLRAIPYGVLQHTKDDYYAVTWQPEPNIRLASVVVKANNFYVVSSRSILEIEKRETNLEVLVFIGWLLASLTTATWYKIKVYDRNFKELK